MAVPLELLTSISDNNRSPFNRFALFSSTYIGNKKKTYDLPAGIDILVKLKIIVKSNAGDVQNTYIIYLGIAHQKQRTLVS